MPRYIPKFDNFIIVNKSIATTFADFLNEMAKPSEKHTNTFWYHGTSEDSIDKIIKDKALKPSDEVSKRTKRMMAPVFDKVYLTSDIDEAISYAYLRANGKKPYLVIVDGKSLKDIQPDEDIIADLLQTEDTIKGFEWLEDLANETDNKLYNKFKRQGDYAYTVSLAKKIVNRLSDSQKIELINKGLKVAHSGMIEIYQVWELPEKKSLRDKTIVDASNYKKIGKRIY